MSATSNSVSPLCSAPASPSDAPATEFNTQSLESAAEIAVPGSSTTRKRKRTATAITIAETTSVAGENVAIKVATSTTTAAVANTTTAKAAKKPRRTKAQKEADEAAAMIPIAVRAATKTHFIGAHVSAAKGVHNSILNSHHIGANAFALFLKSQRKWSSPPLDPANIKMFKAMCSEHKYDPTAHMVPHGSYLVNLAQPDPDKAKQAYECFLDDLKRCEQLGIGLYNFHPGSTLGQPRDSAIARIAAHLNAAHASTPAVVTLLENMAGAGNVLGGAFEDLRDIISLVTNKSRVGVCLDTCHAFAAGHDLRTASAYAATIQKFDDIVGLKYLRALHLNDSKAPFASNRDLHANIGTGFLGLEAFRLVVNDERLYGIPMVLETPLENNDTSRWAQEIKLLEGMVGKTEEEIKEDAERLQKVGETERKRVMEQVEKRVEKEKKAAAKGTGKRGKKKAEEVEKEQDEGEMDDVDMEGEPEAKPKPKGKTKTKAPVKRTRKKPVKQETESDPDTDADSDAGDVEAPPPPQKQRAKRARKVVSLKVESEGESS